jgi:DNA-binding transcriptional regulator YdaS (Cro superfamily)
MTPDEFRAALKELSIRQGWLAARLGVHPVTVSKWAHGTLEVPPYASFALELLRMVPERRRAEVGSEDKVKTTGAVMRLKIGPKQ